MRLANKTALITGGNSGIGLATARVFVAEGARVAITGRDKAKLDAAAKELGPDVLAIVADATDVAASERAVAAAVSSRVNPCRANRRRRGGAGVRAGGSRVRMCSRRRSWLRPTDRKSVV